MTNEFDGAGNASPGTIKVIGTGQSLRGDDAAALAAVQLWIEIYQEHNKRPCVQVELAELPGIGLLNLLEGASFTILVDAVRSGMLPGTLHQLTEDQLEAFEKSSGSAHGWGVAETLSLGRKLALPEMPENIILLGIEIAQVELGETLSPEVEAILPEAARLIEQHVTAALSQLQTYSSSIRTSPR